MSDGGYYALVGFLYQYNRSLLEILSKQDTEIYLEKEEDISSEFSLIQVKNHEKGSFCLSAIADPIINLIKQHKSHPDKKLLLVGYINNWDGKKQISFDDLQEIIGRYNSAENRKHDTQNHIQLTVAEKKTFINSLEIDFSKDRETQTKIVIELIKKSFQKDEETSVLYHSFLLSYLQNIVANNRKEERKVSFRDIKSVINEAGNIIFFNEHKSFLGQESFISTLKKVVPPLNSKHDNLFIFSHTSLGTDKAISTLITDLTNTLYKHNTDKVPNIILDMSEEKISSIKKYLLQKNIPINDGREDLGFFIDIFSKKPLEKKSKTTKILESEFKVRLLSSQTFSCRKKEIIDKIQFDCIYSFGQEKVSKDIPVAKKTSLPDVSIEEIEKILKIK